MSDAEGNVSRDLAWYLLPVFAIPFALVGGFYFFAFKTAPNEEVFSELLSQGEAALIAVAEEAISVRAPAGGTARGEVRISRVDSGDGSQLRVLFGSGAETTDSEWVETGLGEEARDSLLKAMAESSVRSLLSSPRGDVECVEFTFEDEIQDQARLELIYVRGGTLAVGEHFRSHSNGQWRTR